MSGDELLAAHQGGPQNCTLPQKPPRWAFGKYYGHRGMTRPFPILEQAWCCNASAKRLGR